MKYRLRYRWAGEVFERTQFGNDVANLITHAVEMNQTGKANGFKLEELCWQDISTQLPKEVLDGTGNSPATT